MWYEIGQDPHTKAPTSTTMVHGVMKNATNCSQKMAFIDTEKGESNNIHYNNNNQKLKQAMIHGQSQNPNALSSLPFISQSLVHSPQYLQPCLTMDPMLLNQGVSLASTLFDWPHISGPNDGCISSYLTNPSNSLILPKEQIMHNLIENGPGLVKEDGVSPPPGQKIDTSKHYHIFVGDLSPEIDAYKLRDIFSNFGFVTECKIIKDMHTHKPKGYGFVAYANYEEAELAKIKMNGQMLGNRAIRTNWAVRKPPSQNGRDQKPLNYEEVSSASSATNSTIYIGAVPKALEENTLKEFFKDFGTIQEIRIFKEKGYAFVRFESHDLATKSIIEMHGNELCGSPVKVSWGKETGEEKDIIQQIPNPNQSLSTSNTSLNNFINPELLYSPVSNANQSSALTAKLLGRNVLPHQFYSSHAIGPQAIMAPASINSAMQQNPFNMFPNGSIFINPNQFQSANGCKNLSNNSNAFLSMI